MPDLKSCFTISINKWKQIAKLDDVDFSIEHTQFKNHCPFCEKYKSEVQTEFYSYQNCDKCELYPNICGSNESIYKQHSLALDNNNEEDADELAVKMVDAMDKMMNELFPDPTLDELYEAHYEDNQTDSL